MITVENLKLLIVEDDPVSADFLTIILKKYCMHILYAKSGPEAVEICRKNDDLDLILMDIRIPGMSGFDATMQIRKFNPNIWIIAQTAYGLFGDRDKCIEAGCSDYIAKPITKPALLEIIGNHFLKR